MLTLVIASDVRLYNEGIRELLVKRGGFEITASVTRADDAIRVVAERPPMVVLLDQGMPCSLEALKAIRTANDRVGVIALGVPEQEDCLLDWAEAGVAGFVSREASGAELVTTIESAVRGELVCSPRFSGTLLRQLARRAALDTPAPTRSLTAREIEVLRLIAANLSNKEIARRLGISMATVKNHVHNLLDKLNVRHRAEAVASLHRRDLRAVAPDAEPGASTVSARALPVEI
ncbi:MAG TPA: response regulator transcription factor [Gemmatimonadaceae bacterium]|jgi:DNA-binding NarL/FixJ family response regulator